jgi:hypothetical protein
MSAIFSRRNHQYSSMRSGCSLHSNSKPTILVEPSKSSIVALRKIEALNKDNLTFGQRKMDADSMSSKNSTPRMCRRAMPPQQVLSYQQQQPQSPTSKKLPLRSPLQSPQIIKSTRIMNGVNNNACKFHHSKSPGSSGTSVESIVPKYGNGALFTTNTTKSQSTNHQQYIGGAQKRAYNVNNTSNKLTNKVINTRHHNNGVVPVSPHSSSHHHHYHQSKVINNNGSTSSIIYNKNKENIIKENRIVPNTTCRSSFSSKFPNGLPFEDEFYRRQPRHKSVSDTSRSPSDSSLVPFEDEFSRKPSNEALYVDFTKQIGGSSKLANGNGNNYFDKFDQCADDDDDDDINLSNEKLCEQPVVYVAVASWVPKCNRLPYETNIEEPTNEILE